MITVLKRLAFSLSPGLLLAWAMSTKFEPDVAIGSGAAASAFGYAGASFAARLEHREAARRHEDHNSEA